MFTKLQIYLLATCILAAAAAFGVYVCWQTVWSPQLPTPSSDSLSRADVSQEVPKSVAATDGGLRSDSERKSTPITPHDDNDADKIIGIVMQKLASSFKAGDYSYAIEVMYAPMLERWGGKEKAVQDSRAVVAQMKEQQMVLVSWETKKPYRYVDGEERRYAIVPYEAVMNIGGRTLRQESYQLGIKTADSSWQFVNGDRLTPEMFQEFFPDYPKTVELPEVKQNYE